MAKRIIYSESQSKLTKMPKFLIPLALLYLLAFIFPFLMAFRPVEFGDLLLAGGSIFFIASYSIGDVITEVYGYPVYRIIIWSSLAAQILLGVFILFVLHLPSPKGWAGSAAFGIVYAHTLRYTIASTLGNFFGDFINAYFLSKYKVLLRGAAFWKRSLASTLIGESVETTIVFVITFFTIYNHDKLMQLTISTIVFKISYALVMIYFTNWLVKFLKRSEGIDVFDRKTNFNPFKFKL